MYVEGSRDIRIASNSTREKYLNHEFGIVDNEKLEIADITQTEK